MSKEHRVGLKPEEALSMLDRVSKTFCIAKWLQVTLNLHTGSNASCCLTPSSRFSIDGVKENLNYFHNTEENKKDRKDLLDGKKIKNCNFCWNQESAGNALNSERVYKSASPWSHKYLDEVLEAKGEKDIEPTYLEVSFSSKCNLRCIYCNPQTSTGIYKEIERFGPYTDSIGHHDIREIQKQFDYSENEQSNPYIAPFFDWFEKIANRLEVIRITGGEPLLSENLFKLLESFILNPRPHLMIEINSNLSLPESIVDRLITTIEMIPESHYKGLKIISSIDTGFKEAQYIRNGLKTELLQKNVEKLLVKIPKMELRFTVTYSLFSVFNFSELLSYVLELKREYKTYDKILLSIYPLIAPYNLSLKILDSSFGQLIQNSLDEMNKYRISDTEPFGFNEYEVDSMEKILEFYKDTYPKSLKRTLQKDFYIYVKDYDLRKETNILEVFPGYKEFFEKCEKITLDDLESLLNKKDLNYEDCKELIKSYQRSSFVKDEQKNKILQRFELYLNQNIDQDLSKPWGLIQSLYREEVKDLFSEFFLKTILNYQSDKKIQLESLWLFKTALNSYGKKNEFNLEGNRVLQDLHAREGLEALWAWIDIIQAVKPSPHKKLEIIKLISEDKLELQFPCLKVLVDEPLNVWVDNFDRLEEKSWVFAAAYFKDQAFFKEFILKVSNAESLYVYALDFYLNYPEKGIFIEEFLVENRTENFVKFLEDNKSDYFKSLSVPSMLRFKKVLNLLKS